MIKYELNVRLRWCADFAIPSATSVHGTWMFNYSMVRIITFNLIVFVSNKIKGHVFNNYVCVFVSNKVFNNYVCTICENIYQYGFPLRCNNRLKWLMVSHLVNMIVFYRVLMLLCNTCYCTQFFIINTTIYMKFECHFHRRCMKSF